MNDTLKRQRLVLSLALLWSLLLWGATPVQAQDGPADKGVCLLLVGPDQWSVPALQTLATCADMIFTQAATDTDGISYGIWNMSGIKIGPGGDIYLTSDGDNWEFWRVTDGNTSLSPQTPAQPSRNTAPNRCSLLVGSAHWEDFSAPDLATCTAEMYVRSPRDADGIVHGSWNGTQIKIGPGGDVYLSEDGTTWTFWNVTEAREEVARAEAATAPASPPASSPDSDGDGIADSVDQCPDVPENLNGIFENDGCPDTFDDLLEVGIADIDTFWAQIFAVSGMSYARPNVVSYEDSIYVEACGGLIQAGFFYCGNVHGIYYDRGLMTEQFTTYGDFAPIMVLAHEWGHAIQTQLGITPSNHFVFQLEQTSDCMAGAYAASAEARGFLEDGDLDEAVRSLMDAADQEYIPFFHPQAHGTADQRIEAFSTGWHEGVSACLP